MNAKAGTRVAGVKANRGRPPKGARRLSTEVIVQAALEEIAEVGVAAMSARSVARRLNVDSKSLYNHVADKEGLLNAVADFILSSIELPEATGDLATDLNGFARAFRAHALRFPEAATLVMTRQTRSPSSLAPVEGALSVLLTAGFDTTRSVHHLRMMMTVLVGTVLREADADLIFGTTDDEVASQRQAFLEASGLPAVIRAAKEIATIDHEVEFDFAIEMMVRVITEDRDRLTP